MTYKGKEMKAVLFDAALKARGVTKLAYAAYANIPYDTVAGWKKRDVVPDYALGILKNMPIDKKGCTQKQLRHKDDQQTKETNLKILQAVFWGKNITIEEIMDGVKRGDQKYLKPIFQNIFYKDIIALIGIKTIANLKPILPKMMEKDEVDFWNMIIKHHKRVTK